MNRVTNAWSEKLDQALARGYQGLRVSGDTFWLQKRDWQDFCTYESQLNESISSQAMTLLCTYPLAQCGAAEILDVARTQQFAIARRHGVWEVNLGMRERVSLIGGQIDITGVEGEGTLVRVRACLFN